MTPIDPLTLAAELAAILETLGIRYVIGGSVASSILGEPRSTLDLDLMVEIDERQARLLVARLRNDFYIDEQYVVEAVRVGSSFNAIHYGSSMKVDFFPAEIFASVQMERRRALRIRNDLPPLYFYSPEDLVVRKLMWFRAGGEASARQWRDVVGILKLARETLDRSYLMRAAQERALEDLLRRAAAEAGFTLMG